jgi:drug/metabolite transporter (DMT)-like permease
MPTASISKPAAITAHLLSLPVLFILMWSTGYVVGKVALPYAGPFTLLFLRFGVAAAILLIAALLARAPWPKDIKQYGHLIVVGLLLQALQFSGLYSGLALGVSAGIAALITGTMPLFTALGASAFLDEKVSAKQWLGLIAGLFGVALVVGNKVGAGSAGLSGYGAMVVALAGITLGTLYQKKYCASMDLRTGGFVQLGVASLVALYLSLKFEGFAVQWTPGLIFASCWLSIVNSIGAISLLFIMMRKGEASKVASLFYLIPGVTAIMGFAVLDETMTVISVAGFIVTAGAVYVCTRIR